MRSPYRVDATSSAPTPSCRTDSRHGLVSRLGQPAVGPTGAGAQLSRALRSPARETRAAVQCAPPLRGLVLTCFCATRAPHRWLSPPSTWATHVSCPARRCSRHCLVGCSDSGRAPTSLPARRLPAAPTGGALHPCAARCPAAPPCWAACGNTTSACGACALVPGALCFGDLLCPLGWNTPRSPLPRDLPGCAWSTCGLRRSPPRTASASGSVKSALWSYPL